MSNDYDGFASGLVFSTSMGAMGPSRINLRWPRCTTQYSFPGASRCRRSRGDAHWTNPPHGTPPVREMPTTPPTCHMASSEFHGLLRARNRQENDDTYEGPWRLVQRKNKTRSDSISSGSTTACPRRQASIRIKRFLDDF